MIVNVFIRIRNTIEDKLNMKESFNIKSHLRNATVRTHQTNKNGYIAVFS